MRTNFLAPLFLTWKLLPLLKGNEAHGPARIINVSSRLEKNSKLTDKDLKSGPRGNCTSEGYNMMSAYSDSKHAQLLGSLGLANSLKDQTMTSNVVVHAVTPGMVHTNLSRFLPKVVQWLAWPVQRIFLRTPEQGAQSVLYAATASAPALTPRKYYSLSNTTSSESHTE
jgi:retinol dehydrogenase 12